MESKNPEEQKEETLATPGVLDKYQAAGQIANTVLEKVIALCKPGARIVDICETGDNQIEKAVGGVYNKKKIEKGIAFPTCISVNEICGHYSPLKSDADDKEKENNILKEGDVAKIDLGVHIDGYIALVGHTIIVGDKPAEGRKADAILAAYKALQVAFNSLKPGNKNNDVTSLITQTVESYKCNAVEGVLSHDLKKFLIDGNNVIINKETFDQKADDYEFNIYDVFALDVIVSTGEGKPKNSEFRTTVHKRALEKTYTLKTKHGREFFYEITKRFPTLCFSSRAFSDEITAKLGISECQKHDLLVPYPILLEKPGEIVAQFQLTAIVLQTGTIAITGLPIKEENFKTENQITDEAVLQALEAQNEKNSHKKEKKKNKKEGTETEQKE